MNAAAVKKEYVVQFGKFSSCEFGHWVEWNTREFRYDNLEDAQWMEKFQRIVKGRQARLLIVETTYSNPQP